MKILFSPTHYIFDGGDRGSELSWAYDIADRLSSKMNKSVVVTGSANIKGKKNYRIVELQKEKKEVDLGIINAFKFNFLYTKFTLQAINSEKFDLLHHILPFGLGKTYNLSFFFLAKLPKVIGPIQSPIPFFKDNIEDANKKESSFGSILIKQFMIVILSPILEFLSFQTLKKSDRIIVVNEFTKNILISKKIDAKKIVIIPPGVDCSKFKQKSYKKRKKLELISVGALIDRKGFDMLIKAVCEVVKVNNNVRLRIIGIGPQKEKLESQVKELGLKKFIFFEGRIPYSDIQKYYRSADIFVTMTRAEGFATISLEALASGLPIISTKVGGFKEVVVDGENGFLVDFENYKEFAGKILSLMNDSKIRKMGKKSRKMAEDLYDWRKSIIPKYLDVYNETIC